MIRYLVRRLLLLLPTFLGVSVLAFGLIRMIPGDPVLLMLGERGADPAVYDRMKSDLGLDRPIPVQYGHYVSDVLRGNLGTTIRTQEPVLKEFWARFPATIELSAAALLFALLLGIPAGILAAVRRNTVWDYSVIGTSLVGFSMPIFWWGLVLILFFSVKLGWTPVSGRIGAMFDVPTVTGFLLIDSWFSESGWEAFKSAALHLVLPGIALGTIPLAVFARMTRSSLLEVLGEDYVRTAKAKGLSRFRIIWVHALRNAMIPVLTVVGLMVGTLLTGAILTETIFGWPGIGKWIVEAVSQRDYPVIQGGVLLISAIVIGVNFLVDLSYAVFNPRMRVD